MARRARRYNRRSLIRIRIRTAGQEVMVATAEPLIEPNAQNQYQVTADDLPLCCPMPQMYLWNSHPRVYLPIQDTGAAKCPYCSAEYTLLR
jgi:uncharacterized Zn-finger protein